MAPPIPDAARMKRDLAKLISIDSQNPPGDESAVAAYVGAELAAAGFAVARDEFLPGRINVVARLDNGPGPVFAFNTHMDTVPAGDGWTSDALTLREADERLYGRGANDCKGPLALMIEVMRALASDRAAWSGSLLGVFVADEEIGSAGARHYAAGKPKIDFVLVGEPTSNRTFAAHKGSLRPVVRVHGVTAHSGSPHLGDNAIYRAGQLLGMIAELYETTIGRRTHPLVGQASLTVTRIHGGHADNVIPDACDLLLDRRMIPGEDENEVKAEIAALLVRAKERSGLRADIVEYRVTTGGATETPVDSPIVQASMAACRAHGTADPGPFGLQGACDLVHFNAIGASGVVIGPGDLGVAHKPDEYVPEAEFVAASLIYRDIALSMLREGTLR